MSDALDLKLGRLASNLLLDLDECDALNYANRQAASNQKAALILDALEEAGRIAIAEWSEQFKNVEPLREPVCCGISGCEVNHIGQSHRPDSLIDRGP